MTFSVLMSVYRKEQAEYLDRALQSVWDDQTLKPDCIVLVEDGPLGEDLRKVIDVWKQRLGDAMLLLRNEDNIGLTKSLNKGIEHITTDLIARMDSDDISRPERFEHQVRFLQDHPDISVVGGDIEEFYPDGKRCVRTHPYSPEAVRRSICKASPMAHPTIMMRRSIFDNGIRYNEKYRNSQDVDLWFRVIEAGHKLANIEEVVLDFRMSDNVFARRGKEAARKEFHIYMKGISKVYGLITLRYIYPIGRYMIRMAPTKLVRAIYNSKLRNRMAA